MPRVHCDGWHGGGWAVVGYRSVSIAIGFIRAISAAMVDATRYLHSQWRRKRAPPILFRHMILSENYFIRETGTNRFVKFKPDNPAILFSMGQYILSDGLTGAAIFSKPHARAFIRGLKETDLEAVSVQNVLNQEALKQKIIQQ